MIIVKGILLFLIFLCCSYVGKMISNQYKKRVDELQEMKKSFLAIETKMKYTYDVLPQILEEIANGLKENISNIFKQAANFMKTENAKDAWVQALSESKTSMTKEDIDILKGFGKLLGKTDIEGQVSQIELTNQFLETQIEKARQELAKNEKLYKTLGTVSGLALVILLI